MTMKKIIELTRKHEASAKALLEAVAKAYPPGSVVRAKITGGDDGTWINAEVLERPYPSGKYPHELLVKNIKTGKLRNVSVHPEYGHKVEMVSRMNSVIIPHHVKEP